MQHAFVELLGNISKWLIICITIAEMIAYFVPTQLVENYLHSGWQPMLTMLVIGIPL